MNSIVRRGIQNVINIKKLNLNSQHISVSCRNLVSESKRNSPIAPANSQLSYDELVKRRHDEAERSIVVQVNSEKSFSELYNYCSDFGTLINAHHYRIPHEDWHYILIEYSTKDEANQAIKSSSYNEDLTGVPVRSPFLWFKAEKRKSKQEVISKDLETSMLKSVDGIKAMETTELDNLIQNAENIEDQIKILHDVTALNDLGIRLRFLAAHQIQYSICGMFPEAIAQPFGSSVNGFGKMGCDLDLILRFDHSIGSSYKSDSRLVFHTKENLSNGRSQTQRQMESIGDIMQLFLPGVGHVRRILQARVPIIKYHHEHLDLEVDLSMSNLSGAFMSELFYLFGEIDSRVRPLVFCIRRWAQTCGLTNPSPGRWISNFSLTCLVLFFLQQMKIPILPTINALVKSASKDDIRVTEDGINCTFGRDLKKVSLKTKNTQKLYEILLEFFEFYSQFDFTNRAISLNEGRAIHKPDHSALYIVNPLEQALNVSKNISLEECERLRIELRNATWILESELETTHISKTERTDTPWGILNIFKSPERAIIRPNMFFKTRMVEVSTLFGNDSETPHEDTTKLDIKNDSIRQQLQKIKAQAKTDLKQMEINVVGVKREDSKVRRR